MAPMFVWRYVDRSGQELGTSESFVDRDGAEAWMAEAWKELHQRGVEDVELIDRERGNVLYRMGLSDGSD